MSACGTVWCIVCLTIRVMAASGETYVINVLSAGATHTTTYLSQASQAKGNTTQKWATYSVRCPMNSVSYHACLVLRQGQRPYCQQHNSHAEASPSIMG